MAYKNGRHAHRLHLPAERSLHFRCLRWPRWFRNGSLREKALHSHSSQKQSIPSPRLRIRALPDFPGDGRDDPDVGGPTGDQLVDGRGGN